MNRPAPHTEPRKKRHIFQAMAVFLLLAALSHFAVETERSRREQDLRNTVTQNTLGLVSRLEMELGTNVSLANGMYALISAVPDARDAQIQAALKALYENGRYVRNVGLAPDNRLTHIYPLEGNEAVLGLYYPDVPQQWPAVRKAMALRATVLAGPVRLRQGGTGLISRTPVFREDGSYWGILSLVLDADALFNAVDLAPEVKGVRYALRGMDGGGDKGEVFLGDASVFGADAVRIPFDVPGGAWTIAALPMKGWSAGQEYLDALESAMLLVALFLALAFNSFQKARQQIAASEQRLRAFLETARDGVIVIDQRGVVHEFNHAAEQLFGYTAREMLGSSVNRLMSEADARQHDGHIHDSQLEGVKRMGGSRQIMGRRKDGGTFPAEITVGNMLIDAERVFVGVVRDITKRKEYERQLVELATTDGLTGALNRRAFMEDAELQHQLALRHARPLSLMMVDADHFKKVNDTHGHHVGDQVLIRLTRVIQASLRGTDRLGRIGGEEFAVLMPETSLEQAGIVCERLLRAVRETEVEADAGKPLKFTVSIGIATLAPDSRSIDTLMRQADAALYRAKADGRDRCCMAKEGSDSGT